MKWFESKHVHDAIRKLVTHPFFGPALVGLLGTAAVLGTLDGAGLWNTLPGPGVTSDETIYVPQGKALVWALTHLGPVFFEREWVQHIFGGMPDHPPLSRWLLGWAHWFSDPQPDDLNSWNVMRARLAPAIAYGLLLFLIGGFSGRLAGCAAGWIAALATLLMPRLFAHAHFAATDTFIAWFYCAALVSFHGAMQQPRNSRRAIMAGFVTGLALLTKMHAVLLPMVLVPWAAWFWGRRSLKPLALWGCTALATFVLGWPWIWPWLWDSPAIAWEHLRNYLAHATQRASIRVWYFGSTQADHELPFHYPWVMFGATVPAGLHVLGAIGVRSLGRRIIREPAWALLAAGGLVMLVLFSIPGVVVYDGVRLFLMVFPLWAAFIGRGGTVAWNWLREKLATHRHATLKAATLCALFWAGQTHGLVWFHPFQLSYYNALVGGLWGADRLGWEVTYWGDSVERDLLLRLVETAPAHAWVHYHPQLHPLQIRGMVQSSPFLKNTDLRWSDESAATQVRAAGNESTTAPRLLIVYNRQAYLDDVRHLLRPENLMERTTRQGVWLSAIYRVK